jgi:hypothetical protein
MKKIKFSRFTMSLLVIIFAFSLSNCSVHMRSRNASSYNASHKAKKLPPGQAKKIYGGKSAKKYAPGHNK